MALQYSFLFHHLARAKIATRAVIAKTNWLGDFFCARVLNMECGFFLRIYYLSLVVGANTDYIL